jgi:hypothetical protein
MQLSRRNGLPQWCHLSRRGLLRTGLTVSLCLGAAVGVTCLQPASAKDRERTREGGERAREAGDRAREAGDRAREAGDRAREAGDRAREAGERAWEQKREDTERGREEGEKSQEPAKGAAWRSEEDKGEKKEGPPATVQELIRRLVRPTGAGRPAVSDLPYPSHSETEVLVVGMHASARAKARALGFTIGPSDKLPHSHVRVTRLHVPNGIGALAARNLLRLELPSERFALNHIYRPYREAGTDRGESDPRVAGMRKASIGGCGFARCYASMIMEWDPRSRGCARNVRVGVIDTSVDVDHPAFTGRTMRFANFLPEGATRAVNWHGTGVLGVLAGDPSSGTPGLIPDSDFFLADIYHAGGDGRPQADTISVIQALNWMSTHGVVVVNMSMAGPHDPLLQEVIEHLSMKGVVFVAAAGNEGPSAPPSYPAGYPQVIAVTAVGKDLRVYSYANRGGYIDVAAPGVGIWTALPNAMEGPLSGTSFAAPHVTAVVAALYNHVPVKTKESFLRAMHFRDLGQPGPDPIYGRGLVVASGLCDRGTWITEVVRATTPAEPR